MTLYFLCIAQSEVGRLRFQVEAQEAYTCKQILGLCHLPPQLENQSGSRKIENLSEERTILLQVGVSIQKPGVQEKRCCCVTYIMACDIK
jgi:hypothetical protein